MNFWKKFWVGLFEGFYSRILILRFILMLIINYVVTRIRVVLFFICFICLVLKDKFKKWLNSIFSVLPIPGETLNIGYESLTNFHYMGLLIQSLCLIVPLLIAVAYFTLAERKIIAAIQRRRGPNVIGYFGLLQPLSDGLKLFVKEIVCPSNAESVLFFFAPLLTFFLSLVGWAVIPFSLNAVIADIDLGMLYIFAVSSLSVYGIIISGWASNSKYAFLGSLRSAAQIVSYEVSIGFIMASIVITVGGINLTSLVISQQDVWFIWPHLPLFGIFLVSALAETNRHPFDLPEAEAELVSGYNVEYSGVGFTLFFLGEYANIILISTFISLLFLGGWLSPFESFSLISPYVWLGLKTGLFVVFFIVIRAALPRFRYDQLITLGWKVFLPLTLGWLVFTVGILLGTNGLSAYII